MPGDFGELAVNIGLGINFLAGGNLFLNSYDTLSYALNSEQRDEIIKYIHRLECLPIPAAPGKAHQLHQPLS